MKKRTLSHNIPQCVTIVKRYPATPSCPARTDRREHADFW
jgi:hypothetical protein